MKKPLEDLSLKTKIPPTHPPDKDLRSQRIMDMVITRSGFSLIELLLSILLILAIVSILFSTSGTYLTSHATNLQSTASKIASREIETLRTAPYSTLSNGTSTFSDPNLSKLPQGLARRTIADYQSSTKIKLITVRITWTINSAPRELKMETLISESGL